MARPPRLCSCGAIVPADTLCACQKERQLERKRRYDRTRPTATQRGYGAEWRKARTLFLRQHSTCTMCANPANVVDHIEPHKGDQRLFWNWNNWQALCTSCHSRHKQRQERASNV